MLQALPKARLQEAGDWLKKLGMLTRRSPPASGFHERRLG
jgi:hypothetical protein